MKFAANALATTSNALRYNKLACAALPSLLVAAYVFTRLASFLETLR